MKNIFGIFRIKPKKKADVSFNVPQVAEKLRTALSEYTHKQQKELKEKDPLFLRINIEKINFVSEVQNSRKIYEIALLNLRKFLSRTKYFSENVKVIERPNHDLRVPYFGKRRAKDKMHITTGFLLISIFSFFIGYLWSRLRYDVYYRRYFYIYWPSVIIAFEVFDTKVKSVFDKINEYIPIDLNESHLQYILSRKTIDKLRERKLKNKISEVLDDPDMVELNKVLKKINS